MHVYLPEKYRSPFIHSVFLFSKVGVLVVNFDDFFVVAYSSHILWSWPLGRTCYHHTSLSSTLYLKGCQFCPTFFLERKSWSQPYQVFFIAPSLIMPPSVSIWVFFFLGWGYVKEGLGYLQGVVFMQNFWNFKVIPINKSFFTSIQGKLVLKQFKWFLWRGFQKWWKLFVLILVKNIKWQLVDQKGLRFNFRVI